MRPARPCPTLSFRRYRRAEETAMSYTSILVHFDDSPSSVKRLDAAARLAERHDAHLIALVLDLAPQLPIYVEGHIPASMIEGLERSEEHTSELQSLMRVSYAGFCVE